MIRSEEQAQLDRINAAVGPFAGADYLGIERGRAAQALFLALYRSQSAQHRASTIAGLVIDVYRDIYIPADKSR